MLSCHMTLFFAFIKAPLSGAVLVTGSRYSRLSAIFFATQPFVVRGGLFLFLAYAQVESSHRLMWILCWKSFPRFLSWKHLKVKKKSDDMLLTVAFMPTVFIFWDVEYYHHQCSAFTPSFHVCVWVVDVWHLNDLFIEGHWLKPPSSKLDFWSPLLWPLIQMNWRYFFFVMSCHPS